jgi:hypothetical protein
MSETELRRQLYDQVKNRAMMYWHIFAEMRNEIGEEHAKSIMKRAIRERGKAAGTAFEQHAPADFDGLKRTFVDKIHPDGGRMFEPQVVRCDAGGLDILHNQCPLKDAYREAGLPEEEMATMLEIAAQVDYGTFEAAGFGFSAETWRPGKSGCCLLHIRPPEATS